MNTTAINSSDTQELATCLAAAELATFQSSDGYEWSFRRWAAKPEPRAVLFCLHGIQSHSGWYAWSSHWLAARGVEVYFLDRRGSGQNQLRRGHTPHPDRLTNDVVQFVRDRRIRATWQAEDPAIILAGLSWGGRLAATIAARFPERLDGLALLYPGIFARIEPTRWQRFLLNLATDMDQLDRQVDIPLDDPKMFTGVPEWQQFIADDPDALHQATVGLLAAGVRLSDEAMRSAAAITCPTLCMLAGRDRIIDNPRTEQFVMSLAASHKTLITYPEAEHTLEFEPDRVRFVTDLLSWIDAIVAQRRIAH